jgi:hypothetical protein
MMKVFSKAVITSVAILVSGCVSTPTHPTVMALPGEGKTYEQFRADDMRCRSDAEQSVGSGTAQNANNNAVGTAAATTAIGAAAGALLGAAGGGSRGAGAGALIGAGGGLLVGSALGSDSSNSSNRDLRREYNQVYTQCMYAKGNKVPVSGYQSSSSSVPPDYYPAQQSSGYAPY